MTNKAYQTIRESVGSQQCVAKKLNIAKRTLQRREKGEAEIPREAEVAMYSLHAFKNFGTIFQASKPDDKCKHA
jgi:hypothetical protein